MPLVKSRPGFCNEPGGGGATGGATTRVGSPGRVRSGCGGVGGRSSPHRRRSRVARAGAGSGRDMSERTHDREDDVDTDPALANSRPTGGDPGQRDDSGTTTGTGENEEFVGRTAGQDLGYEEETGAEARARAE